MEGSDLALLIDAENVSPQDACERGAFAQSSGLVDVRHLYGNFAAQQMSAWREAGWKHGLTPIHHHSPIVGKNASDIALVVDAMQLCEEGIRIFVLASSESDYISLVRRLREHGCVVIGIGREGAHLALPKDLYSVCRAWVHHCSLCVGKPSHP